MHLALAIKFSSWREKRQQSSNKHVLSHCSKLKDNSHNICSLSKDLKNTERNSYLLFDFLYLFVWKFIRHTALSLHFQFAPSDLSKYFLMDELLPNFTMTKTCLLLPREGISVLLHFPKTPLSHPYQTDFFFFLMNLMDIQRDSVNAIPRVRSFMNVCRE